MSVYGRLHSQTYTVFLLDQASQLCLYEREVLLSGGVSADTMLRANMFSVCAKR